MKSVADAAAVALQGSGEPWFPGLGSVLARNCPAWASFDDRGAYGTGRWLAGNSAHPLELAGESAIADQTLRVEILSKDLVARFDHIAFATEVGPHELTTIDRAITLLEMVPDLAQSVGSVVRSLHVLQADPGYDVSHSEPTIPFSIFLSVPGIEENDSILRLAESIVHEAMHLQLTLIEDALPLVATDGEGFSPWQQRNRPARGLLHGLYVFTVIFRYMQLIAKFKPDFANKARQRCAEIQEEVDFLDQFECFLTPHGKVLHARCLAIIRNGASAGDDVKIHSH